MREIKFRAWDGRIMKREFLVWSDTGVPHEHWSGELWEGHPDWILMQYTGLKDKNGKDIYEGDIIKQEYEMTPDANIERGEVFCSMDKDNPGEWVVNTKTGIRHPFSEYEGVEVIGNIYEN